MLSIHSRLSSVHFFFLPSEYIVGLDIYSHDYGIHIFLLQAALIMQVLSLSDEQIRMLPPDQRNSILKLKEQFARSS